MELLKVRTGVLMMHIPYRGAAPALTDLAGGQIPAMMVDLAAGAAFIKTGKIRALAVANPSACRNCPMCRRLPNWASRTSKRLRQWVSSHRRTRRPNVVPPCKSRVAAAINPPAVQAKAHRLRRRACRQHAAQYADLIRTETDKWHKLIKAQRITLD